MVACYIVIIVLLYIEVYRASSGLSL